MAPHHEKCAESLQFDWKSCRGKIVRDRVQIQNPGSTATLLYWVISFEDYINITAKHVIINWGHAPDSADNLSPHWNFYSLTESPGITAEAEEPHETFHICIIEDEFSKQNRKQSFLHVIDTHELENAA